MKVLKNIYRFILPIIMGVAVVLFQGCKNYSDGSAGKVSVNFTPTVKSLVGNTTFGVTVSSVRILAVEAGSGTVKYNRSTFDRSHNPPSGTDGVEDFITSLNVGNYDVYVIANEINTSRETLNNALSVNALKSIKVPGDLSEANLVLMGEASIVVRPKAGADGQGEVSVDGGATWGGVLNVTMQRVAAKVTLSVAKMTSNPSDWITINKVELTNVPLYSSFIQNKYPESTYNTVVLYDNPSGFQINSNSGNFWELGSVIIPEYLPVTQLPDNAVKIVVYAQYNGQNTVYTVPLRGDLSVENYDVLRNNQYVVNLTITQYGNSGLEPSVTYGMLPWSTSLGGTVDTGGTPVFTGLWGVGTQFNPSNPNEIYVNSGGYVDFQFTMTNPSGAIWTASLSNGLDFEFVTSGSPVSAGITSTTQQTIRIQPRNPVTIPVSTELFITYNNTVNNTEIDLNQNGSTGQGNRFVITQNQ